jgi:hypothetical protein
MMPRPPCRFLSSQPIGQGLEHLQVGRRIRAAVEAF